MIFTPAEVPAPADVLPVVECAVPHLTKALRLGIGYADEQQPDLDDRDPWFWSHGARWRARRHLMSVTSPMGWGINPDVPNSGIHLRLADIHDIRVLRSLGGTVPHPGRNRVRRRAWVQDTLPPNDGALRPLSLLADWQVHDDEPLVYLSLPKCPWTYGSDPDVHWRVPVTGDIDKDLANLRFDPGLLPGDVTVTIKVDPTERETG
jgi:hypothetical protein